MIASLYTSQQAAFELGVSDARVRQICIAHPKIGKKHGRVWMLRPSDLNRIRKLPEFGRKTRKKDLL